MLADYDIILRRQTTLLSVFINNIVYSCS